MAGLFVTASHATGLEKTLLKDQLIFDNDTTRSGIYFQLVIN